MEDFSDKQLSRYDYTRRAIQCLDRAIREFIIQVYKEKYGNEWEHKLKEIFNKLSNRQEKERQSSSNDPLNKPLSDLLGYNELLRLVYKYSQLPEDDPIRSRIDKQKIRWLRSYLEEIKIMRNKWAHPNDNDYILDEDVEAFIHRVEIVIKILDIKPAIEEARQIRDEVRREIVQALWLLPGLGKGGYFFGKLPSLVAQDCAASFRNPSRSNPSRLLPA